jgi:enoyl-CoA hydratase
MSVRIEKSGSVWTIIHSRPEARNAVNPESAEELRNAFLGFDADAAASVAVLWGEGGAFCSGWDLKVAAELDAASALHDLDPHQIAGEPGDGSEIPPGPMGPTRLELTKPVIAAVAGPAVAGGMELALWCDFRIMEEDAYMGVYCRRWGIPLIDGGTVRLPRIVGEGRAREIILTGRTVTAAEALRIGLCEYVVEPGGARARAEELAHQIASFPQECVRSDLHSTKRQSGLSVREALIQEWESSFPVLAAEGITGASRFRDGAGRHGAEA